MSTETESYIGAANKVGEVIVMRGSRFMSPSEIISCVEADRVLRYRLEAIRSYEQQLGGVASEIIARVLASSPESYVTDSPSVSAGLEGQSVFDWRLRYSRESEAIQLLARRENQVNGSKSYDADFVVAAWVDGQMVHPCQEYGAITHQAINKAESYLATVAAVVYGIGEATPSPETDV